MENSAQVCTIYATYSDVLKLVRRDKSLFLTHVLVSAVLGAFCGELPTNQIAFLVLVPQLSQSQVASTSTPGLPLPVSNRGSDAYSSWYELHFYQSLQRR